MSDGLTVTLSDQLAEIDQAMALVHDGFVESGYMEPEPSGRRVIPHYLTPGAYFGLAHLDGTPIGVSSVIPDGPWGLPSRHVFEDEFAVAGEMGPVVELGSLVVAAGHRALTRTVFTHMVAAILRVLVARGDDPVALVAVAPEQERFYESLFSVRRLGPARDLYGAPAIVMARPIDLIMEHVFAGQNIARRTMARLLSEPDPAWLRNRLAEREPLPVPAPSSPAGSPDRHMDAGLLSGAQGSA